MLTPLECYQADLKKTGFMVDAAQAEVVSYTQHLYEELVAATTVPTSRPSRWSAWLRRSQEMPLIRGLYVWGGVGGGKTHLIDNFFDCLPFEQKVRLHFHRFMQHVHNELKGLKQVQNPLHLVAERFAQQARIICLDEFHVTDIADAMLLGGLLDALFKRRVTLVTTSNIAPDDLYKGGLQRARFLPAIALIKQHLHIVHLVNMADYRLRTLEQAEIYHYPLDQRADEFMQTSFNRLALEEGTVGEILEINDRPLPTIRRATGVIWFEFQTLCNTPRAVTDYIELARYFNTLFLSRIPQLGEVDNDATLRFIQLVDELYDRNVKLIISAQMPPEYLYCGKKQAFQFTRTLSRLKEMQTHEYLQRPHLP